MKLTVRAIGIALGFAVLAVLGTFAESIVLSAAFTEPRGEAAGRFVVPVQYTLYAGGALAIVFFLRRYKVLAQLVAVFAYAACLGLWDGLIFVIFIGYSGEFRFATTDLPYLLKYGVRTFAPVGGFGILLVAVASAVKRLAARRGGGDRRRQEEGTATTCPR